VTINRALFSSASGDWATDTDVYAWLDQEFHFTLDPCPLGNPNRIDGTMRSWAGERVYCNPPYGGGIGMWLAKAREADVAVFLLPARTDTEWWHVHALQADEIRFVRGRLKFGNAKHGAPFPSVVVIYNGRNGQ
jgi:site-specific DNA-methyltransferase (adenine-specific)